MSAELQKMPEPVACQHIQDCTTPKLCLSVGTCKGYYVMPVSVRESASKMPEPIFIFWSADGERVRLWTKDRHRALQFATDSGVEAQVYVPAENVTAAWQEATRQAMEKKERAERNRDMWKAQCEEQARRLEALHIGIAEHNADCIGQCEARKKIGKTSCYMLGYDRECGDCPRDGMVNLPEPPPTSGNGEGDGK